MNIQDEMQKIHHKFGVSEMTNYKIEQFIKNLIKEDRAKQLILSDVGSGGSEFEKDLFKLIHNYCKNGLKKPELVKKMEWVLGSCKMS